MGKFVVYINPKELFIMTVKNENEFVDLVLGPSSSDDFERREIDDLYVHSDAEETFTWFS